MDYHLAVQPVSSLCAHSSCIVVKARPPQLAYKSVLKLTARFSAKPIKFQLNATTESSSQEAAQPMKSILQQVSDSFALPSEYLEQLPDDLRLDLIDAAFDLSNGPVVEECGQEVAQLLLNLSRTLELADTSTTRSLASKLPDLEFSLTENAKSALGRRLISAGRRFQSMGQYGKGELQKISVAMIAAGKALAASTISPLTSQKPQQESRIFKFGELQVAVTADKAYIGAVIAIVFGVLSWQLGQGVQSIPENSLQYANDNALLLAKSLRGVLLALSYSSAVLSTFTSVGLIFLARQLTSKDD